MKVISVRAVLILVLLFTYCKKETEDEQNKPIPQGIDFDVFLYSSPAEGVNDAVFTKDNELVVNYGSTLFYFNGNTGKEYSAQSWQGIAGDAICSDSYGRIIIGNIAEGKMVRFNKGIKNGFFSYPANNSINVSDISYTYNSDLDEHIYAHSTYTSFSFEHKINIYKKNRENDEVLINSFNGIHKKIMYSSLKKLYYFLYDEKISNKFYPKIIKISGNNATDMGFPENTVCIDYAINSTGNPVGLFIKTDKGTGNKYYQIHKHLGSVWQLTAQLDLPVTYTGTGTGKIVIDKNDISFIGIHLDYSKFVVYRIDGTSFSSIREFTDMEEKYDLTANPNTGNIYLSYPVPSANKVKIHVLSAGTSWSELSELPITYPQGTAIGFNMTDNIIYIAVHSNNYMYLMKYTSDNWTVVKKLYEGSIAGGLEIMQNISGANPVLAYRTGGSNNNNPNLYFLQWRENDYWEFEELGKYGNSRQYYNNMQNIRVTNNWLGITSDDKPVGIYIDRDDNYKVKVMKYAQDTTWTYLGNPGNSVNPSNFQLVVSKNDDIYVLLSDRYSGANTMKIFKWSGGISWNDLAVNYDSGLNIDYVRMGVDKNSVLYFAGLGSNTILTYKYSGSVWSFEGNPNAFITAPYDVIMGCGNTGPFVVYLTVKNTETWQVPISKYDGSKWQHYGIITTYTGNLAQTIEGFIVVNNDDLPYLISKETYEYNVGWHIYKPKI